MLVALGYIHKKNIIHGDLKPQNILLSGKDYDVKLADFGISQALSEN
jgi:serine/threonine protein kinase